MLRKQVDADNPMRPRIRRKFRSRFLSRLAPSSSPRMEAAEPVAQETVLVFPSALPSDVETSGSGLLGHEAGKAQAGDQRDGLVVAVGNADAGPSPSSAASAFARQIGGSPRFRRTPPPQVHMSALVRSRPRRRARGR